MWVLVPGSVPAKSCGLLEFSLLAPLLPQLSLELPPFFDFLPFQCPESSKEKETGSSKQRTGQGEAAAETTRGQHRAHGVQGGHGGGKNILLPE